MAGQGSVAARWAGGRGPEDLADDGRGVVPPDLVGRAAEEREGLDHAGQDRLGALSGHGHDEGVVGVGERRDEHRHQAAAVGEIDVDVAEVALQPLAGVVGQRDEGLAAVTAVAADVAADLVVAAQVAVLVTQAAEELHGGVALLGRRLLVGGKDGVDGGVEGTEDRGRGRLGRV